MHKIQKKFLLISCLFIAAPLKISAVLTTKQAYANLNTALEAFKKNPTQNSAKDLEDAYKQIAAPAVKKAIDTRIEAAGVNMADVKSLSAGTKAPPAAASLPTKAPAAEETTTTIFEEAKAEVEATFAAAKEDAKDDSSTLNQLEAEEQKQIAAIEKIQRAWRGKKQIKEAKEELNKLKTAAADKAAADKAAADKEEELTKQYKTITSKLNHLVEEAKKLLPQEGLADWIKSFVVSYKPDIQKLKEQEEKIKSALQESEELDETTSLAGDVVDANLAAEKNAKKILQDVISIASLNEIAKKDYNTLSKDTETVIQKYKQDNNDTNKKAMENLRAGIILRAQQPGIYKTTAIEIMGSLAALENKLAEALNEEPKLKSQITLPAQPSTPPAQQSSGPSSSAPQAQNEDMSKWEVKQFERRYNVLFSGEDAAYSGTQDEAKAFSKALDEKIKTLKSKSARDVLGRYKRDIDQEIKS